MARRFTGIVGDPLPARSHRPGTIAITVFGKALPWLSCAGWARTSLHRTLGIIGVLGVF